MERARVNQQRAAHALSWYSPDRDGTVLRLRAFDFARFAFEFEFEFESDLAGSGPRLRSICDGTPPFPAKLWRTQSQLRAAHITRAATPKASNYRSEAKCVQIVAAFAVLPDHAADLRTRSRSRLLLLLGGSEPLSVPRMAQQM
eukprot:3379286-Rhodomonas_salina.2